MAGHFRGDMHASTTALPHFWEHTVGSGHAISALRADRGARDDEPYAAAFIVETVHEANGLVQGPQPVAVIRFAA